MRVAALVLLPFLLAAQAWAEDGPFAPIPRFVPAGPPGSQPLVPGPSRLSAKFWPSPQTSIGKKYGVRRAYSLAEYDRDLASARRWAAEQAQSGQLAAGGQMKVARARAVSLRAQYYPRTWNPRDKAHLYHKEVAQLERLRARRQAELAALPPPTNIESRRAWVRETIKARGRLGPG